MNNTFKKIVAILLSVIICLSCGVTAFAGDETASAEKLESDFTCYYYDLSSFSMDFIVVTFDSKYSQIGEIPELYLYSSETTYKNPIEDEVITLKIYEHEGKRYPQLFIDTQKFRGINGIVIGAGAFVTESGEISGKVKIPNNKISRAYDLGVSCELEVFEVEESIDLITSKTVRYATVGRPVEIVGNGEYGKVWLDEITATYTVNGKTVEITSNEFVPQEPGRYVVELKFGDITSGQFEFDVLGESEAYFKSLGDAAEWLLLSPLYLVLGTGLFVLIPGFGTWIGSTTVMGAFAMIPRFFKTLFGGPLYKEYTLK